MLLTTTHQTVDTDDDLREALLSLTKSGSKAMEVGNHLAVSFSLLIHPEPLRMVTSLSVLREENPQGQLKVLMMGGLGHLLNPLELTIAISECEWQVTGKGKSNDNSRVPARTQSVFLFSAGRYSIFLCFLKTP